MINTIYLYMMAKPKKAAGKSIRQIATLVQADAALLVDRGTSTTPAKLKALRVKERNEWIKVRDDEAGHPDHRARARKIITELDDLIGL